MDRRKSLAALCLALLLLAFAPALRAQDSAPMLLANDPQPLVVETDAGPRPFTIEVADSGEERSRGLMFREQMGDDHGMLFVFETQKPVAFWMKNTPMPLDLVFIDQEGEIQSVLRGEPFSEAVISPGMPVRFVFELKAGTAAKNGIRIGDRVRHPVISAASGG